MKIEIFRLGITNISNFVIYSKEIEDLQEDKDLLRDIFIIKREALQALFNAKSYNFAIHLFFQTTNDFCDLMDIVSFLNNYAKGFIMQITLNNKFEVSEE